MSKKEAGDAKIDKIRARLDKALLAYAHSQKGITQPDKLEDFYNFAYAALFDLPYLLNRLQAAERRAEASRAWGRQWKSAAGFYRIQHASVLKRLKNTASRLAQATGKKESPNV